MLVELFRDAARGCQTHSPLNATLLRAAADDLAAGGVTTKVMAGSELDRGGTVPGLRFAGSVHRLVLEGKAPGLAKHYPTVGGHLESDRLWADAEPVLDEHADMLRAMIRATAVQTNEPARSAALYGGLLVAAERAAEHAGTDEPFPVRLLEIGASGGLNLRPHRFGYRLDDGTSFGDDESPVQLDLSWSGRPRANLAVPLAVAERAACDTNPVDATTEDGRRHLSSFVWPDQVDRYQRLQGAIDLATADPVPVHRAEGSEWLRTQLAKDATGVVTVVWHSVVWQYAPPRERARGRAVVAAAAARATKDAPLALLVFEPRRANDPADPYHFDLLLRLWPAGISLHLGTGVGHGDPFTWDERHWL
ncbi:DUF2332 domain-containing protein [Allokutzneria multivorans]|uniref:DUF2332 domain-containing protein n=1 Tax=Allokutzneria multivorans TaxID=1142134 RepID=A0ABP7U8H4_9PSEU